MVALDRGRLAGYGFPDRLCVSRSTSAQHKVQFWAIKTDFLFFWCLLGAGHVRSPWRRPSSSVNDLFIGF